MSETVLIIIFGLLGLASIINSIAIYCLNHNHSYWWHEVNNGDIPIVLPNNITDATWRYSKASQTLKR